jgi:hypothetical protein
MSADGPAATRRVPTVGWVLSSEPATLAANVGASLREAAMRGDLGAGLRRLARPALEFAVMQIGSAAEQLTGIELGGILIDGWRSHRDVVAAADRTLRSPGASETVGLTAHQVSAAHAPMIDVLVDEQLAATIRLAIGVELAVANLMATIHGGRLVAVRVGDTQAAATLSAHGIELARGSAGLDLSRAFSLGPGIPIRRGTDHG